MIKFLRVSAYRLALAALLSIGTGGTTAQAQVLAARPAATYCTSNLGGKFGCDIRQVRIPGTSLNTTRTNCEITNGSQYGLYGMLSNETAILHPGATYQIITRHKNSYFVGMWLDSDGSGSFEPSEWTLISNGSVNNADADVVASFTVPATARLGQTRLRIRTRLNFLNNPPGYTLGADDACANFGEFSWGETRDYVLSIAPAGTTNAAPYCAAPHTNACDEVAIKQVALAGSSLYSVTSCPPGTPYYNFPATAATTGQVRRGVSPRLELRGGINGASAVWIDWNQNQQWEASEWQALKLLGNTNGFYMVALQVPATALLRPTRMRIRTRRGLTPPAAAEACAAFGSGETQDYTLTVLPADPAGPAVVAPPAWNYVRREGGPLADYVTGMAVEPTGGGLYTVGTFQNSASFGPFNISSGANNNGFFLTRYDAQQQPLWIRSTENLTTTSESYAWGVAVDRQGNAYVIGNWTGTVRLNALTPTTLQGEGGLLLKFSPAGALLWYRRLDVKGHSDNMLNSVGVDDDGNVYIGGTCFGIGLNIGNGLIGQEYGGSDVFVAKYNSAGTPQWIRQSGSASYEHALSMSVSGKGDIALLGTFDLPMHLDTTVLVGNAGLVSFIAYYTSDGTLRSARHMGGGGGTTRVRASAFAADGDLLLAGFFDKAAVFQNQVLVAGIDEYNSNTETFLARYSPTGELRWVQAGTVEVRNLIPDPDGGFYLAGSYGYGGIAGRLAGLTMPASSSLRSALIRCNAAGQALWGATNSGSTGGYSHHASGVVVGRLPTGALVLAGRFDNKAVFGSFTLEAKPGYADIFMARMQPAVVTATATGALQPAPTVRVYPSPSTTGEAVHVALRGFTQGVTLTLHDALGRVVHQQQVQQPLSAEALPLHLARLPAGVYLLRATDGQQTVSQRVVRL